MAEKIVQQTIGTRGDYFVTGKVIKVDDTHRCVYLQEFGDQPIPIVSFDYAVKSYETLSTGRVSAKTATTTVVMPKVGQSVLVAREMGTARLPRALGVIQGLNWIIAEEE